MAAALGGDRAFEVTVDPSRPKFYCLEMFAYPSGHAHVGHVRNYIIGDVMARTKRMRGYNVLHPFGWDAFGLPAENAAIKNGIHPEVSTRANIAHMKGQLQRLGISYAWERELATCDAEYYKWNQWLFIRMFESGLAYRRKSSVNWCPADNTVLANEQVVDGGCWRCGTPVETRDLEQWFFRITAYADELLDATDEPDQVAREGADDAAQLDRALGRRPGQVSRSRAIPVDAAIEVFTTRIDTIFGATFVLLGPGASAGARRSPSARATRRRCASRCRPSACRTARRASAARSRSRGSTPASARSTRSRNEPVPDLGRQLRPRRLRHRRHHGRAGARPARLRVRAQVRPADSRGRHAGRSPAVLVGRPDRGRVGLRHARRLGRVQRPAHPRRRRSG